MGRDETIFIDSNNKKPIDEKPEGEKSEEDIDDLDTNIKHTPIENRIYHISFESSALARMFSLHIVPILKEVALYRIDTEVHIVDPKIPSRRQIIEELARNAGAKVFRHSR